MLSNTSFWILTKYYLLEKQLKESNSKYELAHSIEAIYKFLWDNYADWYVEYLKTDESQIEFAKSLFKQFTITASPYCPFETEALWKDFFGQTTLLANELKDFGWSKNAFSVYFEINDLANLESNPKYQEFESIVSFVQNLRSTRGLFAIDPAAFVQIYSKDKNLIKYSSFIKLIAKTEVIQENKENLYSVQANNLSYSLDILSYIKDKPTEIARTNKIIIDLQKQLAGLEVKLANPKFVENAEPEALIESKSALKLRGQEINQQLVKLAFLES
jgi:valyl-tRNA synthetase